jgi:glycolate oxidase iron-sulfur subunit
VPFCKCIKQPIFAVTIISGLLACKFFNLLIFNCCESFVKDYGSLFDKDDAYYQKAQTVSQNTQDIAQFLADKDLSALKTLNKKITYHSPCTMQHGQQLGGLVESILAQLGYEPSIVADAHLCCGSAGTYSIFQPKLSQQLKINKPCINIFLNFL